MNLVEITCYGKTETMERQTAIELYTQGVMACEGSERDRYTNILIDLKMGYKKCSDVKF